MPFTKRTRQTIGLPYTKTYVKKYASLISDPTSINQATLRSWDLTALDASLNNEHSKRAGQQIALSGLKLNLLFTNWQSEPLYVRIWVVAYKGHSDETLPARVKNDPIQTKNFYQGIEARGVDYNGVSRGGFNHMTHAINHDMYEVLYTKRIWMDGHGGTDSSAAQHTWPNPDRNYRFISKWVPCHRTITYDIESPTNIATNGRLFLVVSVDDPWRPQTGANLKTINFAAHCITYWQEPY